MDERVQLIGDYLRGNASITQLSQAYGISRKTVYKWIERYEQAGAAGLEERSRAPYSHPNATAFEIVEELTRARLSHPRWGPKKLVAYLEQHQADLAWPAPSTAGDILKRAGLVVERKRKHRAPAYAQPLREPYQPNDVWSADFKGQFRTRDARMCYPLTITDNASRYPLLSRGLRHPSFEESRPWFEWTFRQYGLPAAIRTDNGAPFGSTGLGGLSRLGVWLMRLGIRPERIAPGHPEQNGRHERFHRTLKEATAQPPKQDLPEQQRAFDEFLLEFRHERPSEALGQRTPASIYRPSPRPYPQSLPEISYEHEEGLVRHVRHNGQIRLAGNLFYVSEALAGEPVLLVPLANHLWQVKYSFYALANLDASSRTILPLPRLPFDC